MSEKTITNPNPTINETLRLLKDIDVPVFSLKGRKLIGKVVDVYDGDTCKIIMDLDSNIIKMSCRLSGIDTPEIKPPLSKANRELEVVAAKKCRNRLIQLATGLTNVEVGLSKEQLKVILNTHDKLVLMDCGEFDKYGRLLVRLYDINDADKCFNTVLVEEGLANSYDGGKKETFAFTDVPK
jgi:endonuclease YncB( thermonuclease family)